MRFKVPQFIDIEDKIFGPLTFKQFVYLAGGAGLVYLSFTLLPFFFGALVGIPLALFALALAFYKVNEKPFIHAVEAFFKFHTRSKLYLWQKEQAKKLATATQAAAIEAQKRSILTESKLKTLSWSLDVIDTRK
ncbi:MAG TPA: PrgI family protein [Candidatus Paceibacterota bacterium]|nr:PrgI family protein [Candidatus Paceibacterota bacterium]